MLVRNACKNDVKIYVRKLFSLHTYLHFTLYLTILSMLQLQLEVEFKSYDLH